MSETRVKICGITRPDDAARCLEEGADYLGVIFARSPRMVSPRRAGQIRSAVPGADLVGVFLDADPDTIADYAARAGLDLIQLHGGETPDFCRALRERTGLPIIKTLHRGEPNGAADFTLFDLEKGSRNRNGAVERLWADADRANRAGHRVFLAGRLNPLNVRAALDSVSPFAVDVCRGVERVPGVKDMNAVGRFIAEVRS
jgi:phosphoribosylanthranilate isomerase